MFPRDSLPLLKPWGLCPAEPQAFCASPVPLCSTSVSAWSGTVVSHLGHVEKTSVSLWGMLQGTEELGSAWDWSALSQRAQRCQEGEDGMGSFCSNQWGRALADPHSAFTGKDPCIHSSRGAICPELNSLLETDERLQRV